MSGPMQFKPMLFKAQLYSYLLISFSTCSLLVGWEKEELFSTKETHMEIFRVIELVYMFLG